MRHKISRKRKIPRPLRYIYKIERVSSPDYEEDFGHVVVARSYEEAAKFATYADYTVKCIGVAIERMPIGVVLVANRGA